MINDIHTNKVEGCNRNMKAPQKSARGLPKQKIPAFMDQLMFESWTNSKLPFSKSSNYKAEQDKLLNVWVICLVALGEFYCKGESFEWEFTSETVVDGYLINVLNELYDYYKDQGYMKDENDIPTDDICN